MEEFSSYTISHREYFEALGRFPITRVYPDLLASLLPAGWKTSRFDVWLHAFPEGAELAPQGFKIHVSSTVAQAPEVLRRVVPVCVRAGVQFKHVADPGLLRFHNSKRSPRKASGKFIAVYPPDTPSFLTLIEALHQATKDLEGPYILSDKRYRDSKVVFYRYGGFQRMHQLNPDGSRRLMIREPGGALVEDERTPYFQLPAWVQDPLPDAEEPEGDGELLNGRYQVEEAFSFSNTGGVYRAIDQRTGNTVCIKEARPRTDMWMGGELTVDSVSMLRRERDNLERLRGLPEVPELIELFQEWEHTFLVTSFVKGQPLSKVRVREDVIVLTHLEDANRVSRFCALLRDVTLRLLDAVEAIHARGLLVGDISPGNVLLDLESGELRLIDFEGALPLGEDSAVSVQWFTPGFRHPERRGIQRLEPFDDFYACGMLLYSLVCPVQTLFELDRTRPVLRFLDHFVEEGLPVQVRRIIQSLLDGRADLARKEAESWALPRR
ncbi:hypothetical protein JY651_14065 [Pyxidicoccus parkwayensis]|uniref:non-specific serine/threonine protein kinase n=1 Tax=Pyxidicoccus parkwayensis TaxID=2813578 RepID=A0ABX7P6F1_9BACT|nr:hypothetical protein [Pyxidicoccus parkwaysis]QSQ25977.1 hypothetical protein JY651_14065 [Pyxidicoccus parkwaysis]